MIFLQLGKKLLRKGMSKEKLTLAGIKTKQYGLVGPDEVHIDLTNECNNECIGCWCRSRFLEEKRMDKAAMHQSLSFDVVKQTLQELARLGCQRIKLIGGGEPFMHPSVMDVITLIKELGMECKINTNFNLLTNEMIERLVELKVDLIDVSVWAGDAKTYCDTHLNQSEKNFERLKNALEYLKECKIKAGTSFPRIRIYNVILNKNHTKLVDMVHFALNVDADMIQFNHIDTVEDKTSHLLLNTEQKNELREQCQELKTFVDWDDPRTTEGSAILRKDNSCIFLHAFFNDFVRRIESEAFEKGNYDDALFNTCYVGWKFARIMADGNVIPCLKAHKIPSGNIYEDSFSNIWNGKKQRLFRKKGKDIRKHESYFKQVGNDPHYIGCFRTCDNLYQNQEVYDAMNNGKKNC